MGFKSILVPLDGSLLAEHAMDYARQIANPETVLHLLSVIEADRAVEFAQIGGMFGPVAGATSYSPAYLQGLFNPVEIKHRESYMRELGDKLQVDGCKVSQQITCGLAAKTILDVAEKQNVDVIVMATHGRTGVSRLVLGSVAESVLHNAPCPVLIIPVRVTA